MNREKEEERESRDWLGELNESIVRKSPCVLLRFGHLKCPIIVDGTEGGSRGTRRGP